MKPNTGESFIFVVTFKHALKSHCLSSNDYMLYFLVSVAYYTSRSSTIAFIEFKRYTSRSFSVLFCKKLNQYSYNKRRKLDNYIIGLSGKYRVIVNGIMIYPSG